MIGSYVTYKSSTYLVVRSTANKVLLLSPDNKVQVLASSVTKTNLRPAKQVRYRHADYLVTGKGLIISLTTCKVMRWLNTDGNRLAILALAN